MKEFEKQIAEYKARLPHMRERLMAAFIMLLIAIVTTVSSSFAWVVLTTSPEVKGLTTTIAANGNLEIALANGTTITAPLESAIGDGGKDLLAKNITWGNLINLADESYGLENIVLRPASLNQNDLLNQPLYGAGYGEDGRVENLVNDFAYAYWNQDVFSADKVKYGVRAVSSVTYGQVGGNTALSDAVKEADDAITTASGSLETLAQNPALQDLAGLMGKYVSAQIQEKLGSDKKEPIINVSVQEVDSIHYLMTELLEIIEESADALAAIYNVAMLRRAGQTYLVENRFTGEYLLTATQSEIQTKLNAKNTNNETIVTPAMLSQLWTLRTDYNTVKSDLEIIATYKGRNDVVYRNLDGSTYPAIETYVCHIADVGTTKVNNVAIGSLSASNIFSLVGSGTKPVTITKGVIKNMHKFTGANLKSPTLTISVNTVIMGTSNVRGQATTDAAAPFVLPSERSNAIEGDTSFKGTDPIAGDTFGLALDFFVRTNAPDSHLILQGSPIYEERDETVTVKVDGGVYNLYKITYQDDEAIAYLNTKNNTYYHYDRDANQPGEAIGSASQIGSYATLLTEKVKYVVGYSGVNRVWDSNESAYLDGDSTTQGAGSCYTFYASSPEDQKKTLQLLEYFRIAFIDQNGTYLGSAQLNTKDIFEQTGKVIVPLELSVTNNSIEGPDGNPLYTIMPLERNTPTFITALVYLDGTGLSNDQVLAAGEIQGQLNIQFGTTADLNAMDDPELMEAKCSVSATMEGATKVNMDTATAAQLKKKITLTVTGHNPNKIEAYFLREINSTQGVKQSKMTFEKNSEGKWVGEHQFTSAGKYVLREVMIDGIMYELSGDPIVFTVEGFTISDVFCADNNKTYMLTDKKFDTSVSLTFATNDVSKMPTSVKGAFVHKETGNRTTVYFTRTQGSTWTGNASFTTSGEYILNYVELNDEYTGLAENHHISINLYLGLNASVYTGENNFAIENGETRAVPMSMVIKADNGEELKGLTGVWLQYSNNGSNIQENGIGATMVWNESRQMYEGTFNLKNAGIYKYSYVSIRIQEQDNYLNTAATSPVITAISSNPPKYVSKSGFGENVALNNDAAFVVRMKNADSATVDAELINEKGETYYVRGVMSDLGGEQDFTFTLPIFEGKQSGTWTLNKIYMTNIYGGANNILYDGSTENGPDVATDEKPMYTVSANYYFKWLPWTLDELTNDDESAENKAGTIKLITSINVSFADSSNKVYGKSGSEITATLGTTHQLGALELLVTVGDGAHALSDYGLNIKSVELKYNFDQSSVSNAGGTVTNPYGSYTMTSANWTNLSSVTNTEYVYNNIAANATDNTKYSISANKTSISVAGRYVAVGELKLEIEGGDGKAFTVAVPVNELNAPKLEVWSKAMTVSIESIAPNKQNHSTVKNKDDKTNTTVTSEIISETEATVYCEATISSRDLTISQSPFVQLRLNNMGDYVDTVNLTFINSGGGDIYLHTSALQTSGFTNAYQWTNSNLCTRYVGKYKKGSTCSNTVFDGTGTLTASSLTITMGDYTYAMSIDTITINNPHIN